MFLSPTEPDYPNALELYPHSIGGIVGDILSLPYFLPNGTFAFFGKTITLVITDQTPGTHSLQDTTFAVYKAVFLNSVDCLAYL